LDAPVDAALDARPDAPPDAYCAAVSASPPDGHHNDGQSCIVAGCHLTGQTGTNAPPYAYAGTLFTTSAGTTPIAGATVSITLDGVEKSVITATNGNFFMPGGVAGLDPPTNTSTATTRASGCPYSVAMSGTLVQGGGNCNTCHRIGGVTAPIHLP
jgi:hypothetical protein